MDQNASALRQAQQTIGNYANVTLHDGFGEAFASEPYDLVISLSVLEHVKRLQQFLSTSVRLTKPGGRIVHRYDLGHALMPATVGERLRVAVSQRFPVVVRASRFTTYPDREWIVNQLRALGVERIQITQSRMPGLKGAMNHLVRLSDSSSRTLADQIIDLESRLWMTLREGLGARERDRLFPAVTISGYRRS